MYRLRKIHGRGGFVCLFVLCLFIFSLMGCTAPGSVSRAMRPLPLPSVVDSLVVTPFKRGNKSTLSNLDAEVFTRFFRDELSRRSRVRLYQKPPTLLPNTAILNGEINGYTLKDTRLPDYQLRAIEIEAVMWAWEVNKKKPFLRVTRKIVYQKVYPAGTTMISPKLDITGALGELAVALAEGLEPAPQDEPFVLYNAFDEAVETDYSMLSLIRGNLFAADRKFPQAEQLWTVVLYDPLSRPGKEGYRITSLALAKMKAAGIADSVISRVTPMQKLDAMGLEDFRAALKQHLGGVTSEVQKIPSLSDVGYNRGNLNLSAAHANLAQMYQRDQRHDLAAHHWGRAYAHNPGGGYDQKWHDLQVKRNLVVGGPGGKAMLSLYLRIPPPATARLTPGDKERVLLSSFGIKPDNPRTGLAESQTSGGTPNRVTRKPPARPTRKKTTGTAETASATPTNGTPAASNLPRPVTPSTASAPPKSVALPEETATPSAGNASKASTPAASTPVPVAPATIAPTPVAPAALPSEASAPKTSTPVPVAPAGAQTGPPVGLPVPSASDGNAAGLEAEPQAPEEEVPLIPEEEGPSGLLEEEEIPILSP